MAPACPFCPHIEPRHLNAHREFAASQRCSFLAATNLEGTLAVRENGDSNETAVASKGLSAMKKSGQCKLCKDNPIDYTKSDIVPKWFIRGFKDGPNGGYYMDLLRGKPGEIGERGDA